MEHRRLGAAWVVFHDGIRELARMHAEDATPDEIEETCELLAADNGYDPDEIDFRLEAEAFAFSLVSRGAGRS